MKCLIAGASVSAGYGLDLGKRDPALWANQFITHVTDCKLSNIQNISSVGLDNFQIFKKCSTSLIREQYDLVLVCWQSMPRIILNFGLENYNTSFILSSHDICKDINLVANTKVDASDLKLIQKIYLAHYNYHWNIHDLVVYTNVLKQLADQKGTKIYYVNYWLPWQNNKFFKKIDYTAPSDLDLFTQELLQIELRNDTEIKQLYNFIHDQYQQSGGIQEDIWLNLYEPLRTIQVDGISKQDNHPGPKSQNVFNEFLIERFSNL